MIREIRTRASYANVVSSLALFAAVGGGAYAATETTSKTIKNNTIKSIDQKDGKAVHGVDVVPDSLTGQQILESSLTQVPFATTATAAGTATNATTADHANTADAAATAEMADVAGNGMDGWVLLDQDGGIISSKNIFGSMVSHPSEGIYCFDDLGFEPIVMFVTGVVQTNNAQDNFFTANPIANQSADCPGSEQAVVESRDDVDTGPAVLQDAWFMVLFD
jgi:hypothetical protein